MGSCFAKNIAEALGKRGVQTHAYRVHEEANSPLLNELLLECLVSKNPSAQATDLFEKEVTASARELFLKDLRNAAGFILTVGVGISCFESASGRLVIRPNPREGHDCTWRVLRPREISDSIRRFVAMLRGVNPKLQIVVTVSPVPLFRSFRTPSALVEDCLSKSALRLGVQKVIEQDAAIAYWPTFEFFRWFGSHIGPVFGVDDNLPRHPNREHVQVALDAFARHFFEGSLQEAAETNNANETILVSDD